MSERVGEDTYESEEEVGQLLIWVRKFDIDELFGNRLARSEYAPSLQSLRFVNEADGLRSALTYGQVLLVVADGHGRDSLSPFNSYWNNQNRLDQSLIKIEEIRDGKAWLWRHTRPMTYLE